MPVPSLYHFSLGAFDGANSLPHSHVVSLGAMLSLYISLHCYTNDSHGIILYNYGRNIHSEMRKEERDLHFSGTTPGDGKMKRVPGAKNDVLQSMSVLESLR